MKKIIYFDHAATTSVHPEVIKEMLPYFSTNYGNASTIYSLGSKSKDAIENARSQVAKSLGADNNEIFFTGSGTESDNWALKGIAYANKAKGNHIITTNIEHHAILNTCKFLEKQGYEVTYVPVEKNGIVEVSKIQKEIKKETILISIMYANNEIGTVQPVDKISKLARENHIYFHTDAVQVVGNLPVNVHDLDIDLLTLSGHKFNGPKGIGVLYIKKGTNISQFVHGGGQEYAKRAGTENVPGIVGIGKAIEIATSNIERKSKYIKNLRDITTSRILSEIPDTILNGDKEKRLPGNLNVSFKYIEGESILLMLDSYGICASSGSACTSRSLEPSHVLLAIGLDHATAHGSLRLTFGEENTVEDINYLMSVLPDIIKKLRKMSPLS